MSNILHSQERGDVLAHVSGNLRRLRQATGLSQAALAESSGISRRMIAGVEAGEANVSLSTLDKLAAAMSVDFVELVRNPSQAARDNIDILSWRGKEAQSEARLLAAVPAGAEAQLWHWTLGPHDRYDAEPDPQGWHEMLFVTQGVLTVELSGVRAEYTAGSFAVYSSAQAYAYINDREDIVSFVRNVIS